MANLSAIVTVKTVNPKRIECASVNCDREGRIENKVQGKLDLRQSSDASGPSIWVEAYLCDVCMSRVKEPPLKYSVQPGAIFTNRVISDEERNILAANIGCPCPKCVEQRKFNKMDKYYNNTRY